MGFFGLFEEQGIDHFVDRLPEKNITVRALKALDFVAPGEWTNITDFDEMVRVVTGDTDAAFLADVRKKAVEIYDDKDRGFQKAFKIYERVDSSDKLFGTAALADKLAGKVSMLKFLEKITPNADTTQSIDLAVKVVSELLAFIKLNGIPGDGIGDFAAALGQYDHEAKIRIAALVAFDGIVPLGPDFIDKCADQIGKLDDDGLESNKTFRRIKKFIPGGVGSSEFVKKAFGAASGKLAEMASGSGMSREVVVGKLQQFIEVSDDKLDYLGAFLDMTTNYFEHTGLQTVATKVIERAANEA
ncbi:MAG: hypothetical protein P1V20_23370 [Verrucomicrobiales bacterium]|nr:hypothetical protein [Verrucomicrobiales bacterium]